MFLDINKCKIVREIINSTNLFYCDDRYKDHYNSLCALMDRLDSSVAYLNEHDDYPESEESFVCFLVFACIIKDGIKQILKDIGRVDDGLKNESKYFSEYCKSISDCETDYPSDDKCFEHLRSLAFAHPLKTNRESFFNDMLGDQVSSWVVIDKGYFGFDIHDPVGVRVYSSKGYSKEEGQESDNDVFLLLLSFSSLKEFIRTRYNQIDLIIKWAKDVVEKNEDEWRKCKVNRTQTPIDILEEIKRIRLVRYQDCYDLDEVIKSLKYTLSDDRNIDKVEKYKTYIYGMLPALCDAVDDLNDELQCELIGRMLCYDPIIDHVMPHDK